MKFEIWYLGFFPAWQASRGRTEWRKYADVTAKNELQPMIDLLRRKREASYGLRPCIAVVHPPYPEIKCGQCRLPIPNASYLSGRLIRTYEYDDKGKPKPLHCTCGGTNTGSLFSSRQQPIDLQMYDKILKLYDKILK